MDGGTGGTRERQPRPAQDELVLGWLWSILEYACTVGMFSGTAVDVDTVAVLAAVVVLVLAQVLVLLLPRSSAEVVGIDSTEQMLDLEEISLWLESDKLSGLLAGSNV